MRKFLLALALALFPILLQAQVMHVHKTDGTVFDVPTSEVSRLTFTDGSETPVPPVGTDTDMNDGSYCLLPDLAALGITDPVSRISYTYTDRDHTTTSDFSLYYEAGHIRKVLDSTNGKYYGSIAIHSESPLTIKVEDEYEADEIYNIRTNSLGFITSCDIKRNYLDEDGVEKEHAQFTYDDEGHLIRMVWTNDLGEAYLKEVTWQDGNITRTREIEDGGEEYDVITHYVYDDNPRANLNTSHVFFPNSSPGEFILGSMIYGGLCGYPSRNIPIRWSYDFDGSTHIYDCATSYDARGRISSITTTERGGNEEKEVYTFSYLSDESAATRPRSNHQPARHSLTHRSRRILKP